MTDMKDIVLRVLTEKLKYHKDYELSLSKVIREALYIPHDFVGEEADFILESTFFNPYTCELEPKVICIILTETNPDGNKATKNYRWQNVFVISDIDYMITALEEIDNIMNEERIEAEKWVKMEREAENYLKDFWHELVTRTVDLVTEKILNDVLPPMKYFDERNVIGKAYSENKSNIMSGYVRWGFKQVSCIYLALNVDKEIDKQSIRHETIHYLLSLKGYGCKDNDLAFWCYCKVFNGGAYENMEPKIKPIYENFIKTHDEIMQMKDKVPFSITILENSLFTFFTDYYKKNMNTEEALSAIYNIRNEIFKAIEPLSQLYNR